MNRPCKCNDLSGNAGKSIKIFCRVSENKNKSPSNMTNLYIEHISDSIVFNYTEIISLVFTKSTTDFKTIIS